jgi:cell wall-associated NlpC family hydrolase
MMNARMMRACTALGALGATCTLTLDTHGASASRSAPRRPGPIDPWSGPATLLARSATGLRSRANPTAAAVRRMTAAGDRIARLPYAYGGGHGSFTAGGYDCSGSVSYVLHAGGLLTTPLDSGALTGYGDAGPGRHVTIYANGSHAWMAIDGRRFDTIAFQETGTRWSTTVSSADGYVVRHPRGL